MAVDTELEAMARVVSAVATLDTDARRRVIRWAADRYGVVTAAPATPPATNGKRSAAKKAASSAKSDADPGSADVIQPIDEDAVAAAITEATEVSAEKLDALFHVDEGVIKILVKPNSLGSNEADKARSVAQILTVIYKVGLGRDTPFDVIRAECERKHCYDSKNFAYKHLPNIPGFAIKREGKSRRLEARHGGITAFPALVDKVLGES